jgi:hypothetical protein
VNESPYIAPEHIICPTWHAHSTWCYSAHGCRCKNCRNAWSEASRKSYKKVRPSVDSYNSMVECAPLRRKLTALSAIGYGVKEIAEITGVSASTLSAIRCGARKFIRPRTAEKINSAYRRLHMRKSSSEICEIVAERAKSLGHMPPNMWRDIENGVLHVE